jgi:hypothetical protein
MIRVCASLVICLCYAVFYSHIGNCLYNSAYTLEKSANKESNMALFLWRLKHIYNKVIES